MGFNTGYEEWLEERRKEMNLPVAYGGCNCECHQWEGVYHCVPCCYPDSEFLIKT